MMKIVKAEDYQITPGTMECQISRIAGMMEQNPENVRFVFQPGQYHLRKENSIKRSFAVSNSDQADTLHLGILMEHMRNVVLDGQGAEFIFHGDMTPLAVSECSGVTVKNAVFDSSIPLSAEALVENAAPGAVWIFLDGKRFPYHVDQGKLVFEREYGEQAALFGIMEFDWESGMVPEGTGDAFSCERAYEEGENLVRLEGSFRKLPKAGDILVLRHGKRIHPGSLVQFSRQITVEDLKFHQTGGLGMVFQFNEDIRAFGISFVPNRARGMKIVSGHDDGLHFSNNKGCITVEQCRFQGLMDDPINVHGTAAAVLRRQDEFTLRCEFRHHQSVGFERWADQGDTVGFIDPGSRSCVARGTAAGYRLISSREFEICFREPVPEQVAEGFALENLTFTPSVICRGNYFGSGRARGVLVTTPKKVLLENNIFESSGSAVVITGDVTEWYESGTCTDVEIRGNEFRKCCTSSYQFSRGVIHIEPCVDPGQDEAVHRNIRIVDNLFLTGGAGILYADHTGELLFEGNRILAENCQAIQPLTLIKCRDVLVRNNELLMNGRGRETKAEK